MATKDRETSLFVAVALLAAAVLVLLVVTPAVAAGEAGKQGDPMIGQVYAAMQKEQVQRSQPFRPFPMQWREDRGLYRSSIHLDFVGQGWWDDEEHTLLRRYFAIPDSNMFVTSFVLSAIVEAVSLDAIEVSPTDESFAMALDAVLSFKDRNRPQGVPAYSFWPQALVNGTWSATPVNLIEPMDYFGSFSEYIGAIFKELGLDSYSSQVDEIAEAFEDFSTVFRIPPDLDDSSVNLALGGWLSQQRDKFPQAYKKWEAANTNITALFELINKYAYRPFEVNNTRYTDLLDTRSYYFIHPFIAQLSVPSLALGMTWLMDLPEDNKTSGIVGMPYHVNNVDMTVASNFLFGTSQAVLEGLNGGSARDYFVSHADFQQVYENTAQLVSWAIETGAATARPDIALLYYPSLYDFLWMAARTARYLNTKGTEADAIPVMTRTRAMLIGALRDAGTQQLLAAAHHDADGNYWDDFLGDYNGVERGEDRMFSTALAVNTLIDVWSVPGTSSSCKLQWAKDIPPSIQPLVYGGIKYLRTYLLSGKFSLGNAFFSGSEKGDTTFPFAYPGTYSYYRNGTYLDPLTTTDLDMDSGFDLVYAMRGAPPLKTYEKFTDLKWWGFSTPKEFTGFNDPDCLAVLVVAGHDPCHVAHRAGQLPSPPAVSVIGSSSLIDSLGVVLVWRTNTHTIDS